MFESDDDRKLFLSLLNVREPDGDASFETVAWCLMDNHVHQLVFADSLKSLQKGMHRICTKYAVHFNRVNGHVGPVFQERFASFPVESEAYLLEAVRYIHLNCKDKGFEGPSDYPWCSYRMFIGGQRTRRANFIITCFGGIDEFKRFHLEHVELAAIAGSIHRKRLTDDEARAIAQSAFGERFAEIVPRMEEREKEKALRHLYASGLSTRQMERLMGIGRGVIRRACGLRKRADVPR